MRRTATKVDIGADARSMRRRAEQGTLNAMTHTMPVTGDYRIDRDQSTLTFRTRHMFGLAPVHGTFELRDGHIHVAERPEDSVVRATIAADSVNTRNTTRDTMVRTQYLDTDAFPDIAFVSTGADSHGDDWVLRGQLTVRGRTHPVDL